MEGSLKIFLNIAVETCSLEYTARLGIAIDAHDAQCNASTPEVNLHL